jgi:tRNA pseudouridine38-40 synthase
MPVVKLLLAYDGTDFHGWARQRDPSIRTIEGTLTECLGTLLRESARLSVAGRTDAGVHARGQVASFRTSKDVPPEGVRAFVNGRLAPEVVVRKATLAPAGFDARSSATAREYHYVIDARPVPDPFIARYVWHRPGALSVGSMRAAARHFVGEHDFASFCRRAGEGRPTARNLATLTVRRDAGLMVFALRADAFCHQMVRSIVGTLVSVGEGRMDPADIPALLVARDRSVAGQLAPPGGLTLERVVYGRRRRI